MDLRSVLNDSAGPAPAKAAPPPQQQQQPPQRLPEQPHHRQPPPQPHLAQSPAQYGYRDYPRPPPQASPGKPPQDYPVRPHQAHPQLQQSPRAHHPQLQHQQPPTPGAYPPPSPYQTPGPYPAGRASQPSLQSSGSFHDVRSPSGPAPVPSPYRSASTPSSATATAGYPFPSQQAPEINSPVQRHQYPPAQYQPQRRESFSQSGPNQGLGHIQGPYMQAGQHPVPQTPPVGSVGSAHQYQQHQRSQSIQSGSTPTSAQSQHQFGPPYVQGSPVAAARPPPGEFGHPGSQPPTPVGLPVSASARQASATASYVQQQQQPQQQQQQHQQQPQQPQQQQPLQHLQQQPPPQPPQQRQHSQQPPSPYQHRLSSASSAVVAQTQSQAQAQAQSSPRPPPPPTKHLSNNYESSAMASEPHRRNHSHSERGQSASVSPKTRVPSLQSNPDQLSPAGEAEARPGPTVQAMVNHSDRGATPAKRKLEDRDLSPKELERREPRPPPGEINGGHVPNQSRNSQPSSSPVMPRKKRLRRSEPPIWARSTKKDDKLPNHANFVLQKKIHSHINGKHDGSARQSRNTSPEATRSHQASHSQPPGSAAEPSPQDLLGPWEPSITGVKPYEEITKTIADFLFLNVVNNEDMQEIRSQGIQFEIEAKLGTLIDKDTNHRVDRAVNSECVIHDGGRIAFRSSMTEVCPNP